jgi:glycosyltransferase involved in cell wall biosynthesis
VRSLHDFSFGCASGERWFRDGSVCTRVHGPGCLVGLGVRGCGHRLDLRAPLRSYRALGGSLPRLASAHAVVVYSAFVQGLAVRSGVEAGRCHAIPYFVERPSAPPPPAAGRSVAFVGRLTANKGLDVLLEALARHPDAWDDLTVVGDGWDRARCEELARTLGIAGRVVFAGWLPAGGVQETLRRAAVVAVPSRWPEPFGIVGLEAMAAARPVVASRIGGIAEWLDDGETGVLVEPGDADALAAGLATVLSDPVQARRLGEEAWRRVAAFSPAAHLAALDAVYAGVRR